MPSEYPDHLQAELRKARQAVAHLDGEPIAQLYAAVEYAASQMEPHLTNLENALGVKIDGGAFALGMQCAGFAFEGTDVMDVTSTPIGRAMFLEIMERGRQR